MTTDKFSHLILKPGREKSILRRHPWIFSGAIARIEPAGEAGDTVAVYADSGELLAYGGYSPNSQISCRVWKFVEDSFPISFESEILDLIKKQIQRAFGQRKNNLGLQSGNAFRLIHGESDQLPGLIVDVFNNVAVIQFLSCGVEKFRDQITELIVQITGVNYVYERSDAEVRDLEGLPARDGVIFGGTIPDIILFEHDLKYFVDLKGGHKTGFYLDQRDNRKKLQSYAKDKDVLDCFSYTGGFSLNALVGGAKSVTSVDLSAEALFLLTKNIELNQLDIEKSNSVNKDVFNQLRLYRDQGRQFDIIILDPPKFAPTRKQVQRASRGYKDINLMAIKLLKPGGYLFTFSCSGGVDAALFQKIIAGAALDARADLQIIERLTQASDHPVLSSFPEGEYLKGLICQKL